MGKRKKYIFLLRLKQRIINKAIREKTFEQENFWNEYLTRPQFDFKRLGEYQEGFYSIKFLTEIQASNLKRKFKREISGFKISVYLFDKAEPEILARIMTARLLGPSQGQEPSGGSFSAQYLTIKHKGKIGPFIPSF